MNEMNFQIKDVHDDTIKKIHVSTDGTGLFIHPENTDTFDGDYAPILLEFKNGVPILYVWPNRNDQDPIKISLENAMIPKVKHVCFGIAKDLSQARQQCVNKYNGINATAGMFSHTGFLLKDIGMCQVKWVEDDNDNYKTIIDSPGLPNVTLPAKYECYQVD